MPKVSVIIPVFNAEKYLRECLDSIVCQTLRDIEIICINDGSTDISAQILEEYAQKDSRIIIITQENLGQGCARNNALKKATGEYILFVDSDDYIKQNTLELLYNKAVNSNLDMLSYGGTNFEDVTGQIIGNPYYEFRFLPEKFNIDCFNYRDCTDFITQMAVSACLTTYRTEFIKANEIRFPEKLFFEDNFFFTKAIFNAKKCGILKDTLYYRRVHSNSTTQNWADNHLDYIKISGLVLDYLRSINVENCIYEKYKIAYSESVVNIYNNFDEKYRRKYYTAVKAFCKKYNPENIEKIVLPESKLKKLFSIKNEGIHKVVTVLGLKLKFKSKKLIRRMQGVPELEYSFAERIFSVKNSDVHKIITVLGFKYKLKSKNLIERKRIEELENNLRFCSERICSLDSNIKTKDTEIKDLNTKIDSMTLQVQSQDAEIKNLINKNEETTSLIKSQNDRITAMSEIIEAQAEFLQKQTELIEKNNLTVADLNNRLQISERELEQYKKEVNDCKNIVNRQKREFEYKLYKYHNEKNDFPEVKSKTKNSSPVISVIIPVYNAEKYLRECLDSIVNQTFNNIEIICVNDGSTDNSLEILREYEYSDNRFIIINQENKGSGATRSIGLEHAKGKYISFIDADDSAEEDMLELMYKTITENDADIAYCSWNFITDTPDNHKITKKEITNIGKFYLDNKKRLSINVEMWNKLYRKELVDKYKIKFPNCRLGDDTSFTQQYLAVSETAVGIKKVLYNYKRNSNGIISQLHNNPQHVIASIKSRIHSLNFIKSLPVSMQDNSINFLICGIESAINWWVEYTPKPSQKDVLTLISNDILNNVPDSCIESEKLVRIKNKDFSDYITEDLSLSNA